MEQQTEKEIKSTPLEYIAFKIPRKALSFVILSIAGTIGTIGLTGINIFILNQTDIISTITYTTLIIISLIFLLQTTLIYKNTIKKGDRIIIREHRGAILSFDKQPFHKKILFNKKDPTTEPTILWNGTATEEQSGAKIIYLKEGATTNTNINLSVPESDWSKNMASMVKLKTYADIAETEYLDNKTILGLKWQDILLIIILLLMFAIIIIQVGIVPDLIVDAIKQPIIDTMKGILLAS